MNKFDFPGCCGVTLLTTFGYSERSQASQKEKKEFIAELKGEEKTLYGPIFLSVLNQYQVAAWGRILEEQGYRVIEKEVWNRNSGNLLTFYLKEVRPKGWKRSDDQEDE
jgi:hypothetical protein